MATAYWTWTHGDFEAGAQKVADGRCSDRWREANRARVAR